MSQIPSGSVRIAGSLLPSDMLGRILAGDREVPALEPESYGLQRSESVRRQASRSWDYLLGVWREFSERREITLEAQWTRLTRDRWLHILLRELDFRDVRANPGIEIGGRSFPVSHLARRVPVHLLAWHADLDHRTRGRTARAPQSMLQELLNRSDEYQWAVLSNGSSLRLLRDSRKLASSAYVEFDLEAMFNGELFADFVLLYRVCHRSRFEPAGGDGAASCPLERWLAFAADAGTRALEQLRTGVEQAIGHLGTGFLSFPSNPQLQHQLNGSHELDIRDFNRALLRIVYRLLFWFVAEDRRVLLDPDAAPAARDRYAAYFSSSRLRQLAQHRLGGGGHGDLWDAVRIVFGGLGFEEGLQQLGLPGLGGIYEPTVLDKPLEGARLSNRALLAAVRALSVVAARDGGGRRPVDFSNLGSEELGSVYESLLELIPRYEPQERSYALISIAGNERKEIGSYYTPSALVECLLDAALEPLLDQACSAPAVEQRTRALLDITVCDPACGSGHFLVAAARRIARRLAAEESGEPAPPDATVRSTLRRVVGPCIYGVDIDPMAAELTRLSLWMAAIEPGKPLNFLDANIRVGNSLIGVTPKLLRGGIPDEAFAVLPGDNPRVAARMRKDNELARAGFQQLPAPVGHSLLSRKTEEIARFVPDTLAEQYVRQRSEYIKLRKSPEWKSEHALADGWCAAFIQEKNLDERSTAIDQDALLKLIQDPESIQAEHYQAKIAKLAGDYQFFHWHLEFAHIFRVGDDVTDQDPVVGWAGGFSCVVGNPPWDRVKLQQQEFFAQRDAEIAIVPDAAERKQRIVALRVSDDPARRDLYDEFGKEQRRSAGQSHLLRKSGRYPLTGRGDVNTYAVFAETFRTVIAPSGRLGIIVPTGIATDKTTAPFFRDIVDQQRLDSLLDFVTNPRIWQNIGHGRQRFVILVMTGQGSTVQNAELAALAKHPDELPPRGKRIRIFPRDLLLVNPNTRTCPMLRSQRDADITLGIHKRVPVLLRKDPGDNPWNLSLMRMFDITKDAGLFRYMSSLEGDDWELDCNIFVKGGQRMLPLYEGKLVHQFDHRLACYSKRPAGSRDSELPRLDLAEKLDPKRFVMPLRWVPEAEVIRRLGRRRFGCNSVLLGHRIIARSDDERSCIAALIPWGAVSYGLIISAGPSASELTWLVSAYNSFAYDYMLRSSFSQASIPQATSEQIPVPRPGEFAVKAAWTVDQLLGGWIECRVLELSYTAYDMEPFARDLGDDGPPFEWDEARRESLRVELDAAYFHLYGVGREDVDYIMETFPKVKRHDEERFGEYRTKRLVLEIYDRMANAISGGTPYQATMDPPPGYGPRHAASAVR